MIRIRFFGSGELIQRTFSGARYGVVFLTYRTTVRGVRVRLCSEAVRKRSQCNGLFSIGTAEAFTVDARWCDILRKE